MPPIRMCICCRGRREQSCLIRIQWVDSRWVLNSRHAPGRSVYLCQACRERLNRKGLEHGLKLRLTADDVVALQSKLI
ncbi:MAG: DUF448 domain-containing protein [Chthonomonas sp.]|nr:DUF448 domain-containing protein [Chthonomonas sp.]